MNIEITHLFRKVLTNSLDTQQLNYLGEQLDSRFNIYRESGFYENTPLPRKTAVDVLMNYFNSEQDIVRLFTFMIQNEGKRFYNSTLHIWGEKEFIYLLEKYKWIFDPGLNLFFIDPFYEHEINLLKKIRIIDLRNEVSIKSIIKSIEEVSSKLGIRDLEWRISLRLYDLDRESGELIRKIIGLLLTRQNLQQFSDELFFCLKELAINASKANYKLLFERFVTRKQGISQDKDYDYFIRLFKTEIEEHGNSRLIGLAREKDKYITLTFQSSNDSVEMWVTNSENISVIEKQAIVRKLSRGGFHYPGGSDEEEYAEGAGFGLNLILTVLKNYSQDEEPLKVVFYPDFVKIGFKILRSELKRKEAADKDAAAAKREK